VPAYRVFLIDRNGHISRPAEHIDCSDDQEAIEKAQRLVDGHDVELWDGVRLVKRFPRQADK